MIQLYGRHTSYNVQKVLWTLDEIGVDYAHTNLGGAYGGLDTDAFVRLNPNRRVPVLVDGDLVVWESNAIVRYLAARYSTGLLWPEAPGQRSQADQWMDWASNNLLPAFIDLFWGFYRTPAADRDERSIEKLQTDCEHLYGLLDAHLSGRDYVCGDTLTIADIPAGTSLFRYFEMGIDVERPPHLMAWYARLRTRDAFIARIVQPFNELFGRLDY